jgi:hypothetical protein
MGTHSNVRDPHMEAATFRPANHREEDAEERPIHERPLLSF